MPVQAFNQADVDKLVAGETQLAGADFSNLKVPRPKAPETKYKDMNLQGASFQNSNLDGRVFWNSNLKSVNFSESYLRNFHNSQCDFSGSSFSNAQFPAVIINGSQMKNCDFSGIDTSTINALSQFRTTDLSGSNFQGANLVKAAFVMCDLTGVNWGNAVLSSQAYIENCTVDVSAKSYLQASGVRLKNIQWAGAGSTPVASPTMGKPTMKTYKPAVSKSVQKGMVPKGP